MARFPEWQRKRGKITLAFGYRPLKSAQSRKSRQSANFAARVRQDLIGDSVAVTIHSSRFQVQGSRLSVATLNIEP
jgi:hypothetical protein